MRGTITRSSHEKFNGWNKAIAKVFEFAQMPEKQILQCLGEEHLKINN